jgi:hypothetical protein
MNLRCRLAAAAALALPLFLCGCSLLYSTRKLPNLKQPMVTQTVTPAELVTRLNQRWEALDSLQAKVEIRASQLKVKEGVEKEWTSFSGIILMRKPENLRVYGKWPVIGNRMFEMVSDGKTFSLWVPINNTVYKGSNALKKKSANQLENLRPEMFSHAMLVRGLASNDLYTVTEETAMEEDAAKKHLYAVSEYVLSILHRKAESRELIPIRVVRFHRDDLLPYQQDIYDDAGNLETQVTYAAYQDFDGGKFPSQVTIKLPQNDDQVVLTVDSVVENSKDHPLSIDQFQIKLPDDIQVKNLE